MPVKFILWKKLFDSYDSKKSWPTMKWSLGSIYSVFTVLLFFTFLPLRFTLLLKGMPEILDVVVNVKKWKFNPPYCTVYSTHFIAEL
jgi:hypothetical protein